MKTRFWLWKNFINGDPVYVAFDNAFPCHTEGGDPMVVGSPCGLAYFEESVNGRPHVDDVQVMAEVRRSMDREQDILKDRLEKAETALAYLRSMTRTQQLEIIGADARRYRWLTRESVAGQDALYVATDDRMQSLRPEDVDTAIDRKLERNAHGNGRS